MGQHRSAQLLNHYLTLSFGLDKVVEVVGNVEAIEEEVELSECLADVGVNCRKGIRIDGMAPLHHWCWAAEALFWWMVHS